MTLTDFFHRLFVGPDAEERAVWRAAFHTNRNEVAKAVGSAKRSERVSEWAQEKLGEAIRRQEAIDLQAIEKAFIERLRGE